MLDSQIEEMFADIKVWKKGDQRAPSKPLLLLLAIGRCLAGVERQIPFKELDQPLMDLLKEFGHPRKRLHSEYPFWRLQNDKCIWELKNAEQCETRQSNTDAKKSELFKYDVSGGFTPEIYEIFQKDHGIVHRIVRQLLSANFPGSIHEDILSAVGLEISSNMSRQSQRDHKFRDQVLMAYEYRCAICNYDVTISGNSVGLDAAHIKWHQAGGPATQNNGLALCTLHHKLFDRGVIGLDQERQILVSQKAKGNKSFDQWVLAFNGSLLRKPLRSSYVPNPNFLDWNSKEVFRSPAREFGM